MYFWSNEAKKLNMGSPMSDWSFTHRPVDQVVGGEGGEEDNLHQGVLGLQDMFSLSGNLYSDNTKNT